MPFYPKQYLFVEEKSSTKGGKTTWTNGWKWRRATMVSTNGAVRMLGPMHALLKHTPLHEQMHVDNAIVLMEVE
jgi:hypothetical protein